MSSLSALNYQGTTYQLPQTRDIVDNIKPFSTKKHQFRLIKDLGNVMHGYALACVHQVDRAIQRRVDGKSESKFSKTYKRLDPQSTQEQYWKIEAPAGSEELKYTIAASKANGAWEKFIVYKNPNETDIKKASWQINGFLPGIINLDQAKNEWITSLRGPNLKKLGELRSQHWGYGNGLLRIHHTLTSQAQCLLDWHTEYGMNGQGVKIGKYKLLVRKLNGDSNAKAYILTTDSNFRENENSNAFIVRTNPQGKISEIIQYSKRSGYALRLVPSNDDIFNRAELCVTNKKEKQRFARDIELYADLIDLFSKNEQVKGNIIQKIDEISKQFDNCEQLYPITVPLENEQTIEAKETLLQVRNLHRFGDKLRLLSRPSQEETIPTILSDFYHYTGLKPGQISFAFYAGGVHSTKIFDKDGNEQFLRSFGPADSRRRFYKSGDSIFLIKDGNLEEFMKGIGVDVTTEEQNKAIYRWTLLQDEALLNSLGIYVERSADPKEAETLHLVCPSGRTLLRELKINIPIGIASMYQTPMMTFPKNSVLKKLQNTLEVKPGEQSEGEVKDRVQFANIEMFHKFLEEIGFKIASPLEIEAFIRKTLAGPEAKTMQGFLQTRIDFKPEVYKSELGVALLEKHLANQGYEKIERINKGSGGNATIVLKCSKDGTDYLARVLTHTGNISAKRSSLQKFASEEKREPLMFMIEEINDLARTGGLVKQLPAEARA